MVKTAARNRVPRSPRRGDAVSEKLSTYLVGGERPQGEAPGEAVGILVDTCAWIDFFRSGDTPLGRALDRSLRGEQLFTCGQVLLELLQGVRSERDRDAVMRALGSLEYLELDARVWVRAAGLATALKRSGRHLPHSDLLIAALALEHGVAVLTADAHFREIPGLALVEG